jgi:hypothetical protein
MRDLVDIIAKRIVDDTIFFFAFRKDVSAFGPYVVVLLCVYLALVMLFKVAVWWLVELR